MAATHPGSVPIATFRYGTKLRWLRGQRGRQRLARGRRRCAAVPTEPTWRLMGFGPQGESPLGPDLKALVTDRSDASGTAYFNATTDEYDLELLARGFGRTDITLPRVLARTSRPGGPILPAMRAGGAPAGISTTWPWWTTPEPHQPGDRAG